MAKLSFLTFDEKLEAAWGLHKIEKAVLEKEIAELRERLAEADEANRRVSDENETLRRDVKTAVMGDSAELQDVKRENEKLREALATERERCAKIAEQARDDTCDGPVAWSMADGIAAAIRESGE